MNFGKILFTQIMGYVPWKTFGRIVERHKDNSSVRTLDCADVFRIMAFAQLTWQESLRDIEICLMANQRKLCHMGIGNVPSRSTLSDALNGRSWQIYHDLAVKAQIWCAIATYVLIAIVRQELKLKSSLYTLLQILSVTIFEKIEIYQALQPEVNKKVEADLPDPLGLFDI